MEFKGLILLFLIDLALKAADADSDIYFKTSKTPVGTYCIALVSRLNCITNNEITFNVLEEENVTISLINNLPDIEVDHIKVREADNRKIILSKHINSVNSSVYSIQIVKKSNYSNSWLCHFALKLGSQWEYQIVDFPIKIKIHIRPVLKGLPRWYYNGRSILIRRSNVSVPDYDGFGYLDYNDTTQLSIQCTAPQQYTTISILATTLNHNKGCFHNMPCTLKLNLTNHIKSHQIDCIVYQNENKVTVRLFLRIINTFFRDGQFQNKDALANSSDKYNSSHSKHKTIESNRESKEFRGNNNTRNVPIPQKRSKLQNPKQISPHKPTPPKTPKKTNGQPSKEKPTNNNTSKTIHQAIDTRKDELDIDEKTKLPALSNKTNNENTIKSGNASETAETENFRTPTKKDLNLIIGSSMAIITAIIVLIILLICRHRSKKCSSLNKICTSIPLQPNSAEANEDVVHRQSDSSDHLYCYIDMHSVQSPRLYKSSAKKTPQSHYYNVQSSPLPEPMNEIVEPDDELVYSYTYADSIDLQTAFKP